MVLRATASRCLLVARPFRVAIWDGSTGRHLMEQYVCPLFFPRRLRNDFEHVGHTFSGLITARLWARPAAAKAVWECNNWAADLPGIPRIASLPLPGITGPRKSPNLPSRALLLFASSMSSGSTRDPSGSPYASWRSVSRLDGLIPCTRAKCVLAVLISFEHSRHVTVDALMRMMALPSSLSVSALAVAQRGEQNGVLRRRSRGSSNSTPHARQTVFTATFTPAPSLLRSSCTTAHRRRHASRAP